MKAIKKILVPVDFSINSKAAFEYAVALADDIGVDSVKALYVYDDYTPASPLGDPFIMPVGKTEEELHEDLQKFIETEEMELGNTLVKIKTKLKTQAIYGSPARAILEKSESDGFDLIVMGAASKRDLREVWFGSTAISVSQQANCPVLLIPNATTYKGTNDIIYACDFDQTSVEHIEVVADVAETLKTKVELLFVKTEENKGTHGTVDVNKMRDVFRQMAPDVKFTAHIAEEDSVVEGVNRFAKRIGADLVTVVTKHRSFWQRFIHASMTKQLAMYAEIPVLVIHVDK